MLLVTWMALQWSLVAARVPFFLALGSAQYDMNVAPRTLIVDLPTSIPRVSIEVS